MKAIWKYPLSRALNPTTLEIPSVSRLVHVGVQEGVITLWIEVQTESPLKKHDFCIVGTGHEIPEDYVRHVGSIIIDPFVWHVYERRR